MKRALILGTIVAIAIAGFLSIRGMLPFIPILGNSMEPELKAGDIITIGEASASEIKVGDVIVFNVPTLTQEAYDYPALVAHRVISVTSTETGVLFRTKGDNAGGEDPFTVRARDIKGTVSERIPYLGFPLLFFQSQQGLIFMIVALTLFAIFLYAEELGQGRRSVQRGIFAPVIEESQRSSHMLERRIETSEGQITGTQQALEKFATAIAEYALHLKSHTSAIQGLSEASQELKKGAAEQNQFLMNLVEKMEQRQPVAREAMPGAEEAKPLSAEAVPEKRETKSVPGHVTPRVKERKTEAEEPKPGEVPGCFRSRRHKPTGGEETSRTG